MMKFILVFIGMFGTYILSGQANKNLELLAEIGIGENCNDIWGFEDSKGNEYAVIGSRRASHIFDINDPSNPVKIAVIPGSTSIWRDFKFYKDHIYVTTDQHSSDEVSDGLTIIDMTEAPSNVTYTRWKPMIESNGATGVLGDCHNLYIDTIQGYCYLSGCQTVGNRGVILLDLNQDLKEPVVSSIIDKTYSHDVFVQDDILYTSDIYLGELTIYDISDKTNPVELGNVETTTRFTHNTWVSHENKYAFTTDEKATGKVDAYDVSDPSNIKRLDSYWPADRSSDGAIPHNAHYLNGFLYVSWYTEGMVVLDVHRPENMIKVASFDTHTDNNGGFHGLWGTTPFLPSGVILGSDIEKGLFIWKPKDGGLQRACYLEGTVTSKETGAVISNVDVEIIAEDANEEASDVIGTYRTGVATAGTYKVRFTHPDYEELEVDAVLLNGVVTTLDVELISYATANVVTVSSNGVLPGTKVVVENIETESTSEYIADENGKIAFPVRQNVAYNIYASKWGYKTTVLENVKIESANSDDIELNLTEGYQDDFVSDLGWTVNSTARKGAWELGVPAATFYGGQTIQVGNDIDGDNGNQCYVTGASASSVGSDDVDNGKTTLTSPTMDFTEYPVAKISYHLFFSNAGGQGSPPPAPDDDVVVTLSNGSETINLLGLDTPNFVWSDSIVNYVTPDDIAFTDAMTVSVTARDEGAGHLVEVLFDGFSAERVLTVSTNDDFLDATSFALYPNPIQNELTIKSDYSNWSYHIYDAQGRIVNAVKNIKLKQLKIPSEVFAVSGIYTVHLITSKGQPTVLRVLKL